MYIPVSYKKTFDEYYDFLEKVDKALSKMWETPDPNSRETVEEFMQDLKVIRADEDMWHSLNLILFVIMEYNKALDWVSTEDSDGCKHLLPRETLWERAKEEFTCQYVELTMLTMKNNIESLTSRFTNNKDFPELSKEKIGSDFKNILDNLCETLQRILKTKSETAN